MASQPGAVVLLRADGWWLPEHALPLLGAQHWEALGDGAISTVEVDDDTVRGVLDALASAAAPGTVEERRQALAAVASPTAEQRLELARRLQVMHGLDGPEAADHLEAVLGALADPEPDRLARLAPGDGPVLVELAGHATDQAAALLAAAILTARPLLLLAAPDRVGILPDLLAALGRVHPPAAARVGLLTAEPGEVEHPPDLTLDPAVAVHHVGRETPVERAAEELARLLPPRLGDPRRVVLVEGLPERAMGLALALLARRPACETTPDRATAAWLEAHRAWAAEGLSAVFQPPGGAPAVVVAARRSLHPSPRPGVLEIVPVPDAEAARDLAATAVREAPPAPPARAGLQASPGA